MGLKEFKTAPGTAKERDISRLVIYKLRMAELTDKIRRWDADFQADSLTAQKLQVILKDIYAGQTKKATANELETTPPHCMECVYLKWIVPKAAHAATFTKILRKYKKVANKRLDLPSLRLEVHVTKEPDSMDLVAGADICCTQKTVQSHVKV